MKRFLGRKQLLLITLLFMLMTIGIAHATQVFDAKTVKSYSSGEKASYLAGAHISDGLAESCDSCHTNSVIDDSELDINAGCIDCHGTLADMAEVTNADHINPHDSHLGDINCTSCHAGHEPSVTYCSNCHVFDGMEISHNNGAKAKSQLDDLDKYAKVKPTYTYNTDILIVGSGATGSTAAITAREANPGAKITIIEKMPISGGNSQLAAGGMNSANSIFQQKLGIKDNPDLMFLDTMKGGKYINSGVLVNILSSQSTDAIKWLNDRGAVMDSPGMGGGASAARMHGPSSGAFAGPYLRDFFKKSIANHDIELRINSKAVRIVTDKQGAVTGVIVKGKHSGYYQINAKVVVLASGGFGANPDFVSQFRPELRQTATSNQPGTQGDGIILGEKIGAALVDIKEIQVNPTLLFDSPVIVSERVRGAGAIFVNRDGKRFISELATRDVTSATIFKQKGASVFMIFDQKVRDDVKQTSAAFELGKAKQSSTIEGLAKEIGVDPATLAKTVRDYNSYVDKKSDPDFGRPNLPAKVDKSMFYAIEVKPAIHYVMGGLKINEKTQVIDKNGNPIPNLLAAGEVTGGVHGANRLGGNSMAETIVFGRIAGQQAAEALKK